MKPTVGRIVHFINAKGQPLAAIIAKVVDAEKSVVNLQIFGDCVEQTAIQAKRGAQFSETPKAGYWTWPKVE